MTHYYCLIMAGREIDETTTIYKVGVGASRQSDRDYLYLLASAVDNNWYFEKWSNDVAQFVRNVLDSITPPNSDDPLDGVLVKGVHIRELVRALKNGTAIPSCDNAIQNAHHLRQWLSLNYRTLSNRQGEASPLPNE